MLSALCDAVSRRPMSSSPSYNPSLQFQAPADEKRHLERLLVVESWIDGRLVRPLQILRRKATRASNTLGHIFTRKFEMNPAKDAPHTLVNIEGLFEFLENVVEAPCFDPIGRFLGIAVHGVGDP